MLINSDEVLRQYIPNAFSTAKGESLLFDKLSPWLASAQNWLVSNICGDGAFNFILEEDDESVLKSLASQIVVAEALINAIPSLDLVLTPNGFGVVNNNNLAPASKERVARLIASLLDNRDKCLEMIISQLMALPVWRESHQCKWFTASLFPNLDLITLCGGAENRWDKYIELRSKVISIEASLAEEYISHELMHDLRAEAIADVANLSFLAVIPRIRPIIIDILQGDTNFHNRIADVVNHIRLNPELFPQWHASATSMLFNPPKFENKKNAKGYWF